MRMKKIIKKVKEWFYMLYLNAMEDYETLTKSILKRRVEHKKI